MDRRTFLARSAVASGAIVAGVPGCGAAMHPAGEARELIARLERGLGKVRSYPRGAIAHELSGHPRPDVAEEVLRLGIEALIIVDVARSAGAALPPDLAEKLAPELPVVDRYTHTYHALLAGMPQPARRALTAKVRARPSLSTDVADFFDGHARELGVARESRVRLRAEAASLGIRLRRQSTNAVIDDCVAKIERVMAHGGASVARARAATTSAMIAAIWQEPVAGLGGAALADPLADEVQRRADDAEWARVTAPSPLWSAAWARPGDEEMQIGAALMPFGLVTCGALLVAGLVVLITGVVQNAEWDGRPRAER